MRIAFALILVLLLGMPVWAAEEDADGVLWSSGSVSAEAFDQEGWREQLEAAGADQLPGALPQDTRNLMEENGLAELDYRSLLTLTPEAFFGQLWAMARERLRQPLVVFGILMGTVILCAMLESMKTALGDSSITTVFSAVSVISVAAAIASPLVDCITHTAAAIQDFATFIAAFIPVFASVITVAGQPVTAGVYTGLLFMACQVVSQIVAETLVPLMGIYLAFCIAGNLAPGVRISAVAKTVKQVVCWVLGLLLTLFVSLLSVQTLVASGGDQVMSKTAKFLLGSFVPVVGSALGDAFAATQGYMKLLKTTVGAFGILAALLTFLPIFLQTVIWYIAVSAASAVSEMLGVSQTAEILKSSSATLGVLMAVILCFALLVIVSTSLVLIVTMGG